MTTPGLSRSASGSTVGRWLDAVDEPRFLTDSGGDSEAIVLGVDEGLEVVEDDRFGDVLDVLEGEGVEQQGVASEARGEAGDGRGGAAQAAGELAVGGAGDETRGDGDELLRAFEVVRAGEALAGEGAKEG